MINRTSSQINRNQDYIAGTVTTVDPPNNKVLIRDRFGTDYQISLHFKDPSFTLPKVGDGWLIRRTGTDWFLDKRVDSGDETTSLAQMNPGDHRIEADNIFLNGILSIKGITFTVGTGVPISTPTNGSIFIRTDGTTGSTFYVFANEAWVALA